MLVKSQVKYIQSLGQKKFRDQEAVFVVEGPKMVKELLQAGGVRPVSLFAMPGWLEENASLLSSVVPSSGAPVIVALKQGELERISHLATPNQVLAIFQKPVLPVPSYGKGVSLLLDGIQDPGNLGTIVRIADWFGVRNIVCSMDSVDIYNPKATQSSMGSIVRVHVAYEDPLAFLDRFPELAVFAATLGGESVFSIGRIASGLIVIGNESKGIREPVLERISRHITIPGAGGAESLNAAVATGIILSHMVRL